MEGARISVVSYKAGTCRYGSHTYLTVQLLTTFRENEAQTEHHIDFRIAHKKGARCGKRLSNPLL